MERIKPWYYDSFVCTADKCPMTCCQEWKIAVDGETEKKWNQLNCPADMNFSKNEKLADHIGEKEGMKVVALENHMCPFLKESGLCSIVLTYGEDTLSETCHIFPREHKDIEDNLMPSCPEVIDRLYEKGFSLNSRLGDIRDIFMEIAGCEDISSPVVLAMAFYIAFEGERKNITARRDFHKIYGPETLLELRNAIEELEDPMYDTLMERNALFYDITENYRKQNMYESVLGPITRLMKEFDDMLGFEAEAAIACYNRFCTEMKKYDGLMKALLQEEFYASLRHNDRESFMIHLEWIAMVFTMIRHGLFLMYCEKGLPSYEEVRRFIVVMIRMTGYEDDDIEEYMEDCFEDTQWEWGYYFLLCSNR